MDNTISKTQIMHDMGYMLILGAGKYIDMDSHPT